MVNLSSDIIPHFNNLDLGILLIIGIFGFKGLLRGFTREVLSILSLAGAVFASAFSFRYAQPLTAHYIHNVFFSSLAALAGPFILFLFIFSLLSRSISSNIKRSFLNSLDHSLGLLFGILKGSVIIVGLFFLFEHGWTHFFSDKGEKPYFIASSKSLPYLVRGEAILKNVIIQFLPPNFLKKELKAYNLEALEDKNVQEEVLQKLAETLSMPKPGGSNQPKTKDEKPQGYHSNQQSEMNRLFQNHNADAAGSD